MTTQVPAIWNSSSIQMPSAMNRYCRLSPCQLKEPLCPVSPSESSLDLLPVLWVLTGVVHQRDTMTGPVYLCLIQWEHLFKYPVGRSVRRPTELFLRCDVVQNVIHSDCAWDHTIIFVYIISPRSYHIISYHHCCYFAFLIFTILYFYWLDIPKQAVKHGVIYSERAWKDNLGFCEFSPLAILFIM